MTHRGKIWRILLLCLGMVRAASVCSSAAQHIPLVSVTLLLDLCCGWSLTHPGAGGVSGMQRAMAKRVSGQAPQGKAVGTQRNRGIGIHGKQFSTGDPALSPHVEVSKLPWKGSQQPLPAVGCSETSHWGPPRPPHSGGTTSLGVSMDVTLCLRS